METPGLFSQVRRLRLLMPINGVLSCKAASNSAPSWDSNQYGHTEAVGEGFEVLHLRNPPCPPLFKVGDRMESGEDAS